jgi:hypothetical protein
MLTKDEITAAPDTLDSVDKAMWLTLIHANQFYRDNKAVYPDVSAKLDAASGTVQGKMLNAILDKIEELGIGEISLRTPDDGLNYSQPDERDALVRYGLSVMYDAVFYVTSTSEQLEGYTQVRQRPIRTNNLCPICRVYYSGLVCPTCGYYYGGY